ncbi:hypothetical protein PYW08_012809 [Mythimna loreyi]|uniref:Uncharacterized protein n=1 Tax=Mythimna loreyi TaxID=667449 RepID=A0ACC2Q1S8_9NEOP|nr:hypothetical protein PYW08_012809 [Mythimna loreyi]
MKRFALMILAAALFIFEKTAQAKLSTVRSTTKITSTPASHTETYRQNIQELTTQKQQYTLTTSRSVTTEKYTTEEGNHGKLEESYMPTATKTPTTQKITTPILSEELNHIKYEESTVQSKPYVSTITRTITTEKITTPEISEEAYQQKTEKLTTESRQYTSTTARSVATEKITPILSEEGNHQNIEEFTAQSVSTTARVATTEKSTTPVSSEETYHKNIEEFTTLSNPFESTTTRTLTTEKPTTPILSDEKYQQTIEDLKAAKTRYGRLENMLYLPLANGKEMPVLALGTALMDPHLVPHIIGAAIDMGFRAIDTAYIYGNEKEIGEGIQAKIDDGTVKREDLFIMSKLWSTYHRTDLVEEACRASLNNLGLSYFDLFMIHNPMSFKEGSDPIPKIASVVQYSQHDFLDAWFGMEGLVSKGLAKSIGVSNFNAQQIQRILDKGRIRPVVNQVENHPYLTQQRLDSFCKQRNITLSCFGVLGSKGTPSAYKNSTTPVIDDALVKVMASGLDVSPAQLLIRYQIERGHNVVVKASSAAHLWDDLQALTFTLDKSEVDALSALNRNKRTFVFKGMGDTHKNYPFTESG